MKMRMIKTMCAMGLGLSMMASGTARAGYVVSDGQYLNWYGTNGIGLSNTDTSLFRYKTIQDPPTQSITAETVGGHVAARILDSNTVKGLLVSRDYAALASDNNYTVNFRFYAQNYPSFSGNPIIIREMNSGTVVWQFRLTEDNGDHSGFSTAFGVFASGSEAALKQSGNTYYFPYNSWVDVSIQRTDTTHYTLYAIDNNGEHDFGSFYDASAVNNSNLIQVGFWAAGTYTGDVSFDKVLVGDAIPEPATLGLLAMGGLFMLSRRRA